MTEGMQSGDDTPLKNIWDEICVQVQYDYSIYWPYYEELMEDITRKTLQELSTPMLQAIWLQTDEGWDWENDLEDCEEGEGNENESIPYYEEDIVRYIVNEYVLSLASNWTNKRIRRHLDYYLDY
jgi:hypothetical protein